LKTYNVTPSFAYKINDWISIGAGVQFEYGKATLGRGVTVPNPFYPPNPPPLFFVDSSLTGNGWAYGFTAGITLTPTPTTTIGLGYRSQLDQKIDGSLTLTSPLSPYSNPNISTTIKLPDMISVGLRQKVTPQWTLLGTVEWSNWSRIGTSNVNTTVAGNPVAIHFNYDDGWFFSLGAEYQWNDRLAVRAGAGYEKSPITDQVRIPLLPDNNRVWLSAGASYQVTKALSFDVAYSHLFVEDTPIRVIPGNPSFDGWSYVGNVDAHVDIISLALKYRFDEPPPPPKSPMYTKAK
jgi:long-chain fatty acid transport protein